MKTLLIMRHGKSSWSDPGLSDDERPLKQRGRDAAERIGHEAKARGLVPDRIVSSKAKRARQTARLFAEASGFDGSIEKTGRLYFTGLKKHLKVINEQPDTVERLMIVGHDPDLEDLVHALLGEHIALPTGTLVALAWPGEHWADLGRGKCAVQVVIRPRELA
ncbi:MAG: histidine phosphatase family protein [Myxococcales bacterium]|nr:histidine phosphatase family protein [Myxococcales bacterium]